MVLAHQYLHKLDEDIRQAVLGNIGTVILFNIWFEYARQMAEEIFPKFDVQDFINLPNYKIYLKLMIDGLPSWPFSGFTLRLKTG